MRILLPRPVLLRQYINWEVGSFEVCEKIYKDCRYSSVVYGCCLYADDHDFRDSGSDLQKILQQSP